MQMAILAAQSDIPGNTARDGFTRVARRLGLLAAVATIVLVVAYAATLTNGFWSLESADQPIREPMFSILELLIIVLMPVLIVLMVAVHAWAHTQAKALSLAAVVFMALASGVTCGVHFAILALSRQPVFARQAWLPLVFGFRWPSVVYALDILSWDFFFPLSMFFAAPAFTGSRLAAAIRLTMMGSGALSLFGLVGAARGDMGLRNVGIVGYVGVFLVVAVLLAVLFYREIPPQTLPGPGER